MDIELPETLSEAKDKDAGKENKAGERESRERKKGWKYHEISPNVVEVRKEKRRGKLMEEEV